MDEPEPQAELFQPKPEPETPVTLESLRVELQEVRYELKRQGHDLIQYAGILQEQCDLLRRLLLGALLAIILFCLGLDLFLVKQWRAARSRLQEQRAAVLRQMSDYQTRHEPLIRNFVSQLHSFAYVHRDFQPILASHRNYLLKYFPSAPANSGTAQPAAAPQQPLSTQPARGVPPTPAAPK